MVKDIRWLGAIVSIMVLSMIGIIFLQIEWIGRSADLVEEKFDKEVFSAMTTTISTIENKERTRPRGVTLNRAVTSEIGFDKNRFGFRKDTSDGYLQSTMRRLSYLYPEFVFSPQNRWLSEDLSEMVDPEILDYFLHQNLNKRGIFLPYHYGVLNNESQEFIVLDGFYAFSDKQNKVITAETAGTWKDLLVTQYKSDLFTQDTTALATLVITFPTKSKSIFKQTAKYVLLSGLFTALIIFCFAYTVYIIMKQKNLSEIKTDFINNMTHEFKTPLATINLAVDSLKSDRINSDGSKVASFAKIIGQENERMLSQVEKVLQISKLSKSELQLNASVLSLKDVLEDAIEHISLKLENENGSYKSRGLDNDYTVYGDEVHLTNLFVNLLDNAIKYTEEPPEIDIAVRRSRTKVLIAISDNGIGMNKDQLTMIFDRFYRVSTGNQHDVKGFGLGLSYVKTVLEAHHGSIRVESKPGQGSTFIVKLPLVE